MSRTKKKRPAMADERAIEYEQALLGGLMLGAQFDRVSTIVAAEHFGDPRHPLIFDAIADVAAAGGAVDSVLVVNRLAEVEQLAAVGGREYLSSLVEIGSAANVERYAEEVRDRGSDRRLGELFERGREALEGGKRDAVDRIVRDISDVSRERATKASWPAPIELAQLLATEPERPRMIVDDWLPAGYATLVAGHGGAGKSSLALHFSVCAALGLNWWGMRVARRRVLYLSCEDRTDVLHWRLARILAYENVRADELGGWLHVHDLVEHDTILYRRLAATGAAALTTAYASLERKVAELRAGVLVVDGVSDTFAGNENDRADVKAYVKSLVRLVGTAGAAVLVHHVGKPAASSNAPTSEGYSGSTGWHNAVRARWYLYPEVERTDEGAEATGSLTLALQKSNLGRADQAVKLRWDDEAHMFVAESASSRFDAQLRDDDERDGIVRAMREIVARGGYVPAAAQGPRTAWHVLSASPEFPETLKSRSARGRFWRHIEYLRHIGYVREDSMRRANRHIVATLVPKSAPDNACADAPYSDSSISTQTDAGAPAPNASYSAGGIRGSARAHADGSPAPG